VKPSVALRIPVALMIHASVGLLSGPLLNVISPDDLVLGDLDPTSSLLERESAFAAGGRRGENKLLFFLPWRKMKRRDIWEDERLIFGTAGGAVSVQA